MSEINDSYFVIFDTQSMVIGEVVIALAVIGFYFFKNKSRNYLVNEFTAKGETFVAIDIS